MWDFNKWARKGPLSIPATLNKSLPSLSLTFTPCKIGLQKYTLTLWSCGVTPMGPHLWTSPVQCQACSVFPSKCQSNRKLAPPHCRYPPSLDHRHHVVRQSVHDHGKWQRSHSLLVCPVYLRRMPTPRMFFQFAAGSTSQFRRSSRNCSLCRELSSGSTQNSLTGSHLSFSFGPHRTL